MASSKISGCVKTSLKCLGHRAGFQVSSMAFALILSGKRSLTMPKIAIPKFWGASRTAKQIEVQNAGAGGYQSSLVHRGGSPGLVGC